MPDQIVLRGYPVRIGAQQQEHVDGLVREFQLIALSTTEARSHVPARLLALVDLVSASYAEDLAAPERLRQQALDEGRPTVDLVYPARPETAEIVRAWDEVLTEVDDYCRHDDLLVLARPAEVVALQQWVLAEFSAQLAGQEPTAWSGPV